MNYSYNTVSAECRSKGGPVPEDHDALPSRVIVVGVSEADLEALSSLLSTVNPKLGWCVVVAQPMTPSGGGAPVQILDRASALRVEEATDGAPLRPDTVFVAPPGHDISIDQSIIKIEAPHALQRPWPSIDRLFVSAARSFAERSIAVVLSGTGNDGAAGVEAIKSVGGVVVEQKSVPASFATGSVDLQVSADRIPRELERLLDAMELPRTDGTAAVPTESTTIEPGLLGEAIAVLQDEEGVDFSGYKTSTLQRQIVRRQRLLALENTEHYVRYLRDNSSEASALTRSLLVTVTAFFRDGHVWDGLRTHLSAAISESKSGQFRVWVPGCASGQEAYTAAMLVADALGVSHENLSGRMKIFATDLDERALEVARKGRYSVAEAEAIPRRLRQQWTRLTGGQVEVLPSLRDTIVFARHNVAFDPPFPHLDLVSLRNTLIYFQPRLQERVLQLVQFALVPNGLLLLGQSERVPWADEMFVVVDDDNHLYRKRQPARLLGLPPGRMVPSFGTASRSESFDIRSRGSKEDSQFYRDILKAVAPAALVLDARSMLLEVVGDVAPWCTVSEGAHSGNVIDLLKDEFRAAVRAMLSQLRHSAPGTVSRKIHSGEASSHISAKRIEGDSGGSIVTFEYASEDAAATNSVAAANDGATDLVSLELEAVYDALQATVEDLSSSNEELQALNEELQASSEELQASSEEVQASNEELEATNEELTSLNQELAARGGELTRTNIDLENIQSSLTNGLIMVDLELRVIRYTPLAVRLFSLIPSDLGRTLTTIPTTIPVPGLEHALHDILNGAHGRIIELDTEDRDLLVQTQPYRGETNQVLGAIVVVIDVSEIAAERRSRDRALTNLEMVTESIKSVVWQRDSAGNLSLLTHRVEELYGLERARVQADPSLLLTAIHPDDRQRVAAISASAEPTWQMMYRIVKPNGSIRWIDETATLVQPKDGSPPVRVGSANDITEQQELAEANRRQSELLSVLFDSSTLGLLVVDANDRILRSSSAIESMTGYLNANVVGRTLSSLISEDLPEENNSGRTNRRMMWPDGRSTAVTVEYLDSHSSDTQHTVVLVYDNSRLRRISAELAAHEQFDQQTGLLTRTFFRSQANGIVLANPGRAAILWIDLDGFKEVNDRLGHRSGDVVLSVIATRLQRAVRKNHLVGRLGGDEFAILISSVDDLDALDILVHRILSSIREPVIIDAAHAFVSASIGVAVKPQDGTTAEELLRNADVAMYSAKQNGRDRHAFFTAVMNRDADRKAALRHQFAAAVRHRDFELHYQPIRYIADGKIAMIEALVRWRRDGELVSASEFIELATETGQLRGLGRIILDCLFVDVDTLYERIGQDHPRVAVNLSATELRERELTDRLLAWHPAAGFEKIVIEVTEQVTLIPGDRAFEILALLRRLGATISIDDFGAGYSSLELLGQLKPGIIKIDKSLTESAAVDDRGARILEAAVGLAGALETTPVIEGVETAELADIALKTGAELAQGYHLGRPMPLAQLIDEIAGCA